MHESNPPGGNAARHFAACRIAPRWSLALIGLAIVVVESSRQLGIALPLPFLPVYCAVLLAAAFSGMATGVAAASLATLYALWAYRSGIDPNALIGNPGSLLLVTAGIFALAVLLGREHDLRQCLVNRLRARERELLEARATLAENVQARSAELAETRHELTDMRQRIDQVMESAPVGVILISTSRALQYLNPAARRQFGLGEDDKYTEWSALLSAASIFDAGDNRVEPPAGPVSRALDQGATYEDYECRIVGADRITRWCSGFIGPVRRKNGEIIGAVVMFVDMTRQQETAAALARLTRLLFRVREQERGALARELHEEIAQALAAIKFGLHADGSDTERVASSLAQIDDLTSTIRQLSLELRPRALDDFGLATAIGSLLERLAERHGVACRMATEGEVVAISDETTTVAYRLVEEAVDNALKHSQPEAVEVRLAVDADDLVVTVADDGSGFDTRTEVEQGPSENHFGLLFMRERVRQCGGTLRLDSVQSRGTTVVARLPLRAEGHDGENEARADR